MVTERSLGTFRLPSSSFGAKRLRTSPKTRMAATQRRSSSYGEEWKVNRRLSDASRADRLLSSNFCRSLEIASQTTLFVVATSVASASLLIPIARCLNVEIPRLRCHVELSPDACAAQTGSTCLWIGQPHRRYPAEDRGSVALTE